MSNIFKTKLIGRTGFGVVIAGLVVTLFANQAQATHKPFTCPTAHKNFTLWDGVDPGTRTHKGQDISMPRGTPLYAISDGSVSQDNSDPNGWGVMARLTADGHMHHYAHLQSVARTGSVKAGDLIAYSGDSGNATGTPHLHWEVWTPSYPSGSYKNPPPIDFWNACTPGPPHPATVTIGGRVHYSDSGVGIAASVNLCNGRSVTSNSDGWWFANLPWGSSFCVLSNQTPPYHYVTGPFGTGGQVGGYTGATATQSNITYHLGWRRWTDIPLMCDWNGDGIDTPGVYRSNGWFHLRNSNTAGAGEINFAFGNPGDRPVCGDWDGNGTDTIGLFRPSNFTWYLRNQNSAGPATTFAYGSPADFPLAGDWDGNGSDSIGVWRQTDRWLLRNSLSAGPPDYNFTYGGTIFDRPLVGDWDKNGTDTPAVKRGADFHLRNFNSAGLGNVSFNYGNATDVGLAGDWNNDGRDTPGLRRGDNIFLRNSNTSGLADIQFKYGQAN